VEKQTQEKKSFFNEGAISPQQVCEYIAVYGSRKEIGAHQVFLGQVRADVIDGRTVAAIDYSCYRDMAEEEIKKILQRTRVKYNLSGAYVLHSLGKVMTGEICFFVFASAAHRDNAASACREIVDAVKQDVPVFGKEIFEDESYQWKVNHA